MWNKHFKYFIFLWLGASLSCSEDDTEIPTPPGTLPPSIPVTCKVEEIEFRNQEDQIIGIREFDYNINNGNRLESISIVEDNGVDVLNLRFRLKYPEDGSQVPNRIDEIFGADIVSTIDFKYGPSGNLTEFTQVQVSNPDLPPESHIFTYEASSLANDSINTRIIIFNIDRLTQEWIDVLPAIFTTGGQRITRFERVSFRGDIFEVCQFAYNDSGPLDEIVCRTFEGLLTEVWNFSYEQGRLVSAYQQLPNFRAITVYEYDQEGKPVSVESTTDGRFNWSGRYFYLCR